MAAAQEAAPATGAIRPVVPLGIAACLLAVVAAIGMRVAHVRSARIIVDEFQHLHSAYLVSRGQTPFVDFFEHHPPLFYYLGAALVPMESPTFETIIHARYLSMVFHLITLLSTALWIRTTIGRSEGVVVGALLIGNFFLFEWGSYIYLDTYAAPSLVLAAWALASTHRLAGAFGAGVGVAAAMFMTQKAAFGALAAVGVLVGITFSQQRRDPRDHRLVSRLGAFAAGGACVALFVAVLLGGRGVIGFIRDAILLNLDWKARHFPSRELSLLASTEGIVFVIALVGLFRQLRSLLARRLAVQSVDIPSLFLVSFGAGMFILPVVWEEYFVLFVPFAIAVAGITMVGWWREYLVPPGPLLDFSTSVGRYRATVILFCAGLLISNIAARYLIPRELFLATGTLLAALGLCFGLATLATLARRSGKPDQGPLWLSLVLAFSLIQQVDAIGRHRNDEQAARVSYILENTHRMDSVFDGYTGFGLFRPHAYKYWFLHEEVQAMLTPEQKGADVVAALQSTNPAFVVLDRHVKVLPDTVLEYIATNYQVTPFADIVRRRPQPNRGLRSLD